MSLRLRIGTLKRQAGAGEGKIGGSSVELFTRPSQ